MAGDDKYLAHVSPDGTREQTLKEHLLGTASLARGFGEAFGEGDFAYLVGLLHDVGKYSKEFQERIRGENIEVDHSTAGAQLLSKEGMGIGSFVIAGHHAGIPDFGSKFDSGSSKTLCGRMRKTVPDFSSWREMKGHVPASVNFVGKPEDEFSFAMYVRMLFSCLVDADYLDTERFMKGDIQRGKYPGMGVLLERLASYVSRWDSPKNEIQARRKEIRERCLRKGRELKKGIYTLNVPTGGGKTMASVSFALAHAVAHGMKRIIYVIPFMSIIDQTAETFGEVFGSECVIEHHSGVEFDDSPGQDRGDLLPDAKVLAVENWDAPLIITTSVQFFESLFSDHPSKCRKLHNIVDSVLVFDEAQSGLPQEHLLPLVKAVSCLCANFGCTALLSTATQPALEEMFEKEGYGINSVEIAGNVDALRSDFRRNRIENIGALSEASLSERMAYENSVLCVVNTRAEAQRLFALLPERGRFCLTTLVCPFYRKRMIAEIRDRLRRGLECRVVSTSLIEAGVDLDFDSVYREETGLDSVIQCAGRCNREGRRSPDGSFVRVFSIEGTRTRQPSLEGRIACCNRCFSRHPGDVDSPESVREYFKTVRPSGEGQYALDRCKVLSKTKELAFRTIGEEFRLIDDDSAHVYIPFGEGETLVQDLRSGRIDRLGLRRLSFYAVPVHAWQAEKLRAQGALFPIDDRHFILQRTDLYSPQTGLSVTEEDASGLFF